MTGAALGTLMVANVQYVIIPNHIRMRNQVKAGEAVNTDFHKLAKRRSQHNNYITLPVLFTMLSAHFPLASGNSWAWAILALTMAAGVALRHYRNVTLATDTLRREWLALSLVLFAGAVALSFVPATAVVQDTSALSEADARVYAIVQTRCATCHSATPTDETFTAAPNGVKFDTLAEVEGRKDQILTRAVASDLMPPGNLTEITDDERQELGDWLKAKGAVTVAIE